MNFPIDVHLAVAGMSHGAFGVFHFDIPEGADYVFGNTQAELDRAVQGILAETSTTLTSQRDIELAGYPGRHMTASGWLDDDTKATFAANLFIVGRRTIGVHATGEPGVMPWEHVAAFLDSFELDDSFVRQRLILSAEEEAYSDVLGELSEMPPSRAEATLSLIAALEVQGWSAAQEAISAGADLEFELQGRPLIFGYVRNDQGKAVEFLLDRGAKTDSQTAYGRTPLHEAALYGHVEIVELLIEHGANVNAKNPRGETPLFYAEGGLVAGPRPTERHKQAARVLRENGAF